MVKAFRVYEHGGPEVLKWEDVEIGEPKAGEIRLKYKAIGLNLLDVYMRKGLYGSSPPLPFTPGMEGSGTVTAIGPGVTSCKVGDVVAHGFAVGAYAEERILPADSVIPIPSSLDPIEAAAIILKGITAQVLIRRRFKVERGHTILVHAAAGGVGSLLCQWANALGATVIGTVSTKEKAVQAKENGCHHAIVYKEENFADRVMEITSGKGVDVVYDSVGKDTFDGSLACLKKLGYFVHFGNASGEPDPIPVSRLSSKPIYFTSGGLEALEDLHAAIEDVFTNVTNGVLKVRVIKYPLSEAAKAHADLEGRKTSGSIVLIPDGE